VGVGRHTFMGYPRRKRRLAVQAITKSCDEGFRSADEALDWALAQNGLKGIVLANAVYDPTAIDTGAPIPSIVLIDIAAAGAQINVPMLYPTGSQDAWANDEQAAYFMNNAATANKKMLTAISADADHMAPATTQGPLFDILSWTGLTESMLGGDAEWNTMDTQFYVPAILHLIGGNPATSFNPSISWE